MSEKRNIQVYASDGTIVQCTVEIFGMPQYKIILSGIDLPIREFTGDDLFDAFIKLRLELEKQGLRLLCAGCRPDVWPSGMSRDMSGGRKAYVARPGAPSRRADLVDIFDYAEPEKVGSVAEQKAFHEKWGQSLLEEMNRGCYGEATSLRKPVRVLAPDGEIGECEVEISGMPPSKIVFSGINLETQVFAGKELFGAFNNLRLGLEKRGLQLLCAGCRPEVISLGFTRTINGEIRAGVLYTDAPAVGGDLIDIFEYAAPEKVGSVAKQQAFHKKWADSCGKSSENDQ